MNRKYGEGKAEDVRTGLLLLMWRTKYETFIVWIVVEHIGNKSWHKSTQLVVPSSEELAALDPLL